MVVSVEGEGVETEDSVEGGAEVVSLEVSWFSEIGNTFQTIWDRTSPG